MFIKAVLSATGRLQAVDAAVSGASYVAGQAYQSGKAVVTLDAVDAADTYNGGFRYDLDGRLRAHDATAGLPANTTVNQGVTVTSTGQVCVTTDANADVAVLDGLALSSDGRIFTDF